MNSRKLFLFEWDMNAALARTRELSSQGTVEIEFEEGSRGCRNCKAFEPDVVVLDLAVKPSHSREVGRALRQYKPMRDLPFVFLDGTEADVTKTKQKVPSGIFTTSEQLDEVLARLPIRSAAG